MTDGQQAGLFGVVEWFRPGERDRVERAVERLQALGGERLRTHLSWAEYHAEGGREWYDWLLPTLGQSFDLLPCLHFTPPSLSETGRSSGAPRRLGDFADFVDHAIDRYGTCFSALELWNEPNNLLDWDWRYDADWLKFCEMVGAAGHWARQRGKTVALGGPCPTDPNWLRLMGERGVLGVVDAVGVHGFPGTWDSEEATWPGWAPLLQQVREVVHAFNPKLELWITETGYSTWRHDPYRQVTSFLEALEAPADRLYWYALQDLPTTVPVQEGLRFDERHYRFGLYDSGGRPKLLARLLEAGGLEVVRQTAQQGASAPAIARSEPILITGGAGFIGSNLADRLAGEGYDVVVYDMLARPGVETNLEWLKARHPRRISAAIADVRDQDALAEAAQRAQAVFHFAAQVAVTSSLDHPFEDFDINARGTLLLLETLRRRRDPPPLLFASTNKVYGDLGDIVLTDSEGPGYLPVDHALRRHGVPEDRPLDFHSPYGCSKGAADQYVLDYARSFGLPTAVLRMSCIYGYRQFGTEDQGWVAHFLLRALAGEPITLYGDGRQVRDILFVEDAVAAYHAAWQRIGRISGRAFNLGGGPSNAVSLLQVIAAIEELVGRPVARSYGPWRQGDQKYFVADTRRAQAALQLADPRPWQSGLAALHDWATRHVASRPAAPAMERELEVQLT